VFKGESNRRLDSGELLRAHSLGLYKKGCCLIPFIVGKLWKILSMGDGSYIMF
jgi:hypothetical protein